MRSAKKLHADVPRVITPQRMGIQIIQDRDGYDRVAAGSGGLSTQALSGRRQLSPSCTTIPVRIWIRLPTSTGERALQQHAGPEARRHRARRRGECQIHGRARCPARTSPSTRAATLFPSITGSLWRISRTPRRRRNVEIRKGDILLVRTGWRKDVGRTRCRRTSDAAHTKWHQTAGPASAPIA